MINNRFDYTAYDDGTSSIYDRSTDEYYFDMDLSKLEELLNQLNDENEQIKQNCKNYEWYKQYKAVLNENEQLKHNNKMLSMKMSEVYTKYCLLKEFSEDTNPNDAVKRVLSELMQITKEYR